MIGFLSDIGNVRQINEDYGDYHLGRKYKLLIVADGMGGHNAGEVASEMAVEGIIEFIKENFGEYEEEEILADAVIDVNTKIYNHAANQKKLSGMGTTIVAALVLDDVVQIVNVGDSVCYGINEDSIEKITKDHSLVQELIDSGSITALEAKKHPRRNIITRAVGTNETVDVDIYDVPKGMYDYFVLCTDGLSNDVEESFIFNEINESYDLQESCKTLVEEAKSEGGKDNITVLVFGGEN
ncbi:MAG: Stp1/IreP family PP2C-type Ser/Thr phosphatase [Sarcina sp.]